MSDGRVADRRRVLWLIRGLGPGGAEHLLLAAAKVHDAARFSFEAAYLLPWKDALVPALEGCGVITHCLDVRTPLDPRWLLRLARLVRSGSFDVVHVQSPLVAGLARPLLRLLPTPRTRPALVYTEHNRWTGYKPGTRLANRLTYGLDDAHLAVSEDTWNTIGPKQRTSVDVVVHGIVLEEVVRWREQRAAVREELGLGDDVVAVVTVANLRAQKAYPDLLEAARLVLAARQDVVWLAIGQGPLEAQVRQMAADMELGPRFRMLGHQPDAPRLVAACDLFALASHSEGYPLSVMEALALGLPVVSTAVGGIPEAVRDGVEGILVPPRRPDLLAQAVLRVAGDRELLSRLSEGARQRGQHHDIRASVRHTEAVYQRLVGLRDIRVGDGRPL
ncbi:MAG: hypothetical protein AVDCRST_MAG76-1518 [uncultured Acidimicrobiales bacterium]|uniref:Glycosyltransferase n=1 Tax=uncultured Acidimicrobiales bacterium TaxID=310071 RepID=A0A6J4HY09_9ACTN|nr:MAG: hypothetical protein AVDCRST_MAG76-1518 [uncultured Acidimicrobiales bacterium]